MQKVIPINVDKNVSPRDFDFHAGRDKLLVHSVFHTFQGEGPFVGHPALFVRLAGCNLGAKLDCPWCDTAFQMKNGEEYGVLQLANEIDSSGVRLVVVTGGEPLLQWATLLDHIERLESMGRLVRWQIETNGLYLRRSMLDAVNWLPVEFVISPKIPHNATGYAPLTKNLIDGAHRQRGTQYYKYVVSADPLSPYHGLPADVNLLVERDITVFVSGMTVYLRAPNKDENEVANIWDPTLVDQAATAKNYAHAARLALDNGLHVSYQTHLFAGVP